MHACMLVGKTVGKSLLHVSHIALIVLTGDPGNSGADAEVFGFTMHFGIIT